MLINNIYTKVQDILNTDLVGNLNPTEFERFLDQSIRDRYEELLFEVNRHESKSARQMQGKFLENMADRLREKIMHYAESASLVEVDATTRTIPSDVRYIDLIEDSNGLFYEMVNNKKEFNIVKAFVDSEYPVCVKQGTQLIVYPSNTGEAMTIHYLREPNYGRWTYTVVGTSSDPVFNPAASDFQDADIHVSEESEMVIRVLQYAGLNLKDAQSAVAAQNLKNEEFQKNNAG